VGTLIEAVWRGLMVRLLRLEGVMHSKACWLVCQHAFKALSTKATCNP
jgi:hypothetical protein